ncbi:glycosyl hydrolase family 114 [Glaciihabitans tibetensis]|uniref:Glycosyl hydrolase family 114 n=1 Tax=Glaciihabitans tibetensis TaxID=1266600 RepID=A0A2T0VCG4_9MICO|nr:endo alpha-1,4 polygalactosaminidase [Glaciihabitans tibetensis]PRY67868.1 glycosyl hydrolase family 114 [Glaciihabitans tibetensis]
MKLDRRLVACSALVAAAALLGGCASTPATSTATNPSEADAGQSDAGETRTLPTDVQADYQLGGSYEPPAGVGLVVRDSGDYPAEGMYSICYVNGFQTQPQDAAVWLAEHPELILWEGGGRAEGVDGAGQPVIDPNWPDEMILDTSTESNRTAIAEVIGETIAQCGERGFDAVEFDNLDSWSRSSGALTLDDSIALATLLVDKAADAGLAAGQKNSAELATRGRDEAGFLFAIAEECAAFDECDAYSDVYGTNVIDIEYLETKYADEMDVAFAEVCADPSSIPLTTLRDRDLVTPDNPDYVFDAC